MSGSERLFLDTNVVVASLTSEPQRGAVATEILDIEAEYYTGLLNIMELRTVLTKKKMIEQNRVERIIKQIEDRLEVIYHEPSDLVAANELQSQTLLYPLDCLLLAIAEDQDATLVTFDAELIDAGARSPSDILEASR